MGKSTFIGSVKRFDNRRPCAIGSCKDCETAVYRFEWDGSDWLHLSTDQSACEDYSGV